VVRADLERVQDNLQINKSTCRPMFENSCKSMNFLTTTQRYDKSYQKKVCITAEYIPGKEQNMIIIYLTIALLVLSTTASIIAITKYRKIQDKLNDLIERLEYNET